MNKITKDEELSTFRALKLALEALENASDIMDSWAQKRQDDAITAIREALAEREKFCDDHCTWRDHHPDCDKAEQPAKQTPVAWIEHEWSGTGLRHLHFERREPTVRDELVNPVWTPLYTSPPASKPWVGLTDDEIALICAECSLRTPCDIYYARAIEAKLREKNA